MINDPYEAVAMVSATDYDSLCDDYEHETERADEAERLLSEMAHAFFERDRAAYAAFVISEPSVIDVIGVIS